MSPPSFSKAATSSAQKKLFESVCRGHRMERAMPICENGRPTQLLAYRSIRCTARSEHPSWMYSYWGLRPVRSTSSCAMPQNAVGRGLRKRGCGVAPRASNRAHAVVEDPAHVCHCIIRPRRLAQGNFDVRQRRHLARRGQQVEHRLRPPAVGHAVKNQRDRRPRVAHGTRRAPRATLILLLANVALCESAVPRPRLPHAHGVPSDPSHSATRRRGWRRS